MDNDQYNVYMGHNQNMNFDHYNPGYNNSAAIENHNLIDLSGHSSNQCEFSATQANMQNVPSYNKIIRTKGARKIIIDQRGTSYEAAPYEMPEQVGINSSQGRNEPLHDMASFNIPDEIVSDQETQDVASDSQNVDENSNTRNEANEYSLLLDPSSWSKFKKTSDINKAVLLSMSRNLATVKFYPGQTSSDIYIFRKCMFNPKLLNFLINSVMSLVSNGFSLRKSTTDKSTQTIIGFIEPPVIRNNYTQTATQSVPRVKINTRSNEMYQKKDLNKEHNGRHLHNLQVPNQETGIWNNQQEQFDDNQNVISQLKSASIYHGQTNTSSRNNVQAPMMHYGMPYTANAMYNASTQRAESGNNGGQLMMQYGIPYADNTMMQNAERGVTGMQAMMHHGMSHNEHSVTQRTDVSRNRMQTMACPRSCHHANATATATVPPTYYNRRKCNVQSAEIPRGDQPMMMQTEAHAAQPSAMRGRVSRSRSYYTNAANPPYPTRAQWQMPAYQDQYHNN